MKIIFFSNSCWSLFNFRRNFIKKFIKKGAKVYIVANNDYTSKFLKQDGCTFINLYHVSNQTNPIREILNFFIFFKILIKIRPNLVFGFTLKPILYSTIGSFFLGFKTVNTFDGLGRLIQKNFFLFKIYLFLLKIFNKNILRLFLVNKSNFILFKKNKILSKDKLVLIKSGTGIDTQYYNYKKITNYNTFMFLGRYLYDKGVIEFCEVAQKLKKKNNKLKFICAGNYFINDPSNIPKSILKKYKKSINFFFNIKDIRKLIYNSTCIVLPSYYNEGLNRSLMESLSIGRPIITTDIPGCRELINNKKNGYLVKTKNMISLQKKIELFSKLNKKVINKMSYNCRKFIIKNYSDEKIIEKYLKLIKSI